MSCLKSGCIEASVFMHLFTRDNIEDQLDDFL